MTVKPSLAKANPQITHMLVIINCKTSLHSVCVALASTIPASVALIVSRSVFAGLSVILS